MILNKFRFFRPFWSQHGAKMNSFVALWGSKINDKIESFIASLNEGDIPEVWADAAYPTMESLDGFLEDLKQKANFMRDWQV